MDSGISLLPSDDPLVDRVRDCSTPERGVIGVAMRELDRSSVLVVVRCRLATRLEIDCGVSLLPSEDSLVDRVRDCSTFDRGVIGVAICEVGRSWVLVVVLERV